MSDIKRAMNDVYSEQHFSEAKKRETLARARTPKKNRGRGFMPVALIAFACLLLVVLLQPQTQMEQSAHDNSLAEPLQDGIIELANRKVAFQTMLEDGKISEQEKMTYLQTSDWALQLAFETGISTTYSVDHGVESPEQGKMYATLLFYMREYIYSGEVHADVVQAFQNTKTFYEFAQLVDVLDPHVLLDYVSVQDEEMPTLPAFVAGSQGLQIGVTWALLLLAGFTIFNLLKKRTLWLLALQLVALVLLLAWAMKPVDRIAAIDETTLLQSSERVLQKELAFDYTSATLLDAAQFDRTRFAFLQLQDGLYAYALVQFEWQDGAYLFRELHLFDNARSFTTTAILRPDGQLGILAAYPQGHNVERAELSVYTNPIATYTFDVQHGAQLRMYYVPQVPQSFELRLYDANGEQLEGQ